MHKTNTCLYKIIYFVEIQFNFIILYREVPNQNLTTKHNTKKDVK